jgi:protocatechuate 3,4-dioxygenase beta subunit
MAKSTKKTFLSLLNLLILFVLFFCLNGCGNKEDEITPTTGSGQQITAFTGSPTSLSSGQTSILTVKVTNSAGTAVSGKAVTFDFTVNNSGGTVNALNGGITDAGGQAVAIYTAGANTTALSLEDTISATCVKATAALIITRTASTSSGLQINLSAAVTSLTAGQTSIISATVTDTSGNPVRNETVTFTKLIDHSTMGLTILGTGTTDASGKAIAVYTAGTANPTADVQDTIEASVSSGASNGAVVITRIGSSTTTVTPGYKMNLTASVTSLAAGEHSILTATVTDGSGKTSGGQTVNFAFVNNNSGTPALSIVSGTTDAAGRISTIYTAGSGSSGSSVQDTISATVTSGGYSSTDAVIITRTASTATPPTGYKMTLTATPDSLIAGAMSVIVAQVNNGDGTAASGQTVTFGFVTNNSGATLANFNGVTTAPVTGITDANGTTVAVYTAGNSSPSLSIQDAVSASVTGPAGSSAGAAVITRTSSTATGNRVSLIMDPATSASSRLASTSSPCDLTATVLDKDGNAMNGVSVTFSIVTGTGSFVGSTTVTTGTSGIAYATFTAPGGITHSETVVKASITNSDAVGIIYW